MGVREIQEPWDTFFRQIQDIQDLIPTKLISSVSSLESRSSKPTLKTTRRLQDARFGSMGRIQRKSPHWRWSIIPTPNKSDFPLSPEKRNYLQLKRPKKSATERQILSTISLLNMPPLPAELPTVHPKPKTTLSIQACDFLVSQQCLATCEPFAIFEPMEVEIPDPALAGLTVTTDEARLSIGWACIKMAKPLWVKLHGWRASA